MIHFNFSLYSPFEYFNNLGCLYGQIGKHKYWELEHGYYAKILLDLHISIDRHCDHAVINLRVGLLGYNISLHFYDTRHWNYVTKSYEGEL